MVFAEEGDGGMRMFSRAAYRGMGDILRSLVALRPLRAGRVYGRGCESTRAVSASLLKTFSKKCLTEIAILLV